MIHFWWWAHFTVLSSLVCSFQSSTNRCDARGYGHNDQLNYREVQFHLNFKFRQFAVLNKSLVDRKARNISSVFSDWVICQQSNIFQGQANDGAEKHQNSHQILTRVFRPRNLLFQWEIALVVREKISCKCMQRQCGEKIINGNWQRNRQICLMPEICFRTALISYWDEWLLNAAQPKSDPSFGDLNYWSWFIMSSACQFIGQETWLLVISPLEAVIKMLTAHVFIAGLSILSWFMSTLPFSAQLFACVKYGDECTGKKELKAVGNCW